MHHIIIVIVLVLRIVVVIIVIIITIIIIIFTLAKLSALEFPSSASEDPFVCDLIQRNCTVSYAAAISLIPESILRTLAVDDARNSRMVDPCCSARQASILSLASKQCLHRWNLVLGTRSKRLFHEEKRSFREK